MNLEKEVKEMVAMLVIQVLALIVLVVVAFTIEEPVLGIISVILALVVMIFWIRFFDSEYRLENRSTKKGSD